VKKTKALYVTEIKVEDPDSGTHITIEIYKDPKSNGLFGVERMFIEQIGPQVQSPYNECITLTCEKKRNHLSVKQ